MNRLEAVSLIMIIAICVTQQLGLAQSSANIDHSTNIPFLVESLDDHNSQDSAKINAIRKGAPLIGWDITPSTVARDQLKKLGKEAVPPLIIVLNDTNKEYRTRINAASALSGIRDPSAIPALCAGLDTTNFPLAFTCVRGLQDMPDKKAIVEPLINLVNAPNSYAVAFHEIIIDVLEKTNDKRLIPTIIAIMKKRKTLPPDQYQSCDERCVNKLKSLTNKDFGTDVTAWEKWLKEHQ